MIVMQKGGCAALPGSLRLKVQQDLAASPTRLLYSGREKS